MTTATDTSGRKLKVALIGPGRISTAHLDAVRATSDIAELVAIAGVAEEEARIRSLVERFSAQRAVIGAETIFADREIDAVILTVPNHLHRPLAVHALASGKHVLVEKPLATSVADSDAMIEAARQAGRVLMVGQCRRFFAGAQMAKARIAELGSPLNITSIVGVYTLEPKASWWKSAEQAGGLVFGLNAAHLIDTAVWLIGARPVRVYADTMRFRSVWEGEDEASFIVSFDDGSSLTGRLSESMNPPQNEAWIIGPNGMMRLVDDRNLWLNGEQIHAEPITAYLDGDVAFRAQFREFANAIRGGRVPAASGAEVRPVSQIIEGARISAAERRAVEIT